MRREKRKRKRKRWKDLSLFWVKPISFQNLYLSHLLIDMAREIVSSLIAKMRNIGVRVDAESSFGIITILPRFWIVLSSFRVSSLVFLFTSRRNGVEMFKVR